MTPEEYINTLTVDEMRYVILQFWDWYSGEGCPATCYPKYKCHRENTDDCDEEREVLDGCWVRYYVWKFHKNKKDGK